MVHYVDQVSPDAIDHWTGTEGILVTTGVYFSVGEEEEFADLVSVLATPLGSFKNAMVVVDSTSHTVVASVVESASNTEYSFVFYPGTVYGNPGPDSPITVWFSAGNGPQGVVVSGPAQVPDWMLTLDEFVSQHSAHLKRSGTVDVVNASTSAVDSRIAWDEIDWAEGVVLSDGGRTITLLEPGMWEVKYTARFETLSAPRIVAWIGSPTDGLDRYDVDSANPNGATDPTLKVSAHLRVLPDEPVSFSAHAFQDSGLPAPLYVTGGATHLSVVRIR